MSLTTDAPAPPAKGPAQPPAVVPTQRALALPRREPGSTLPPFPRTRCWMRERRAPAA
ncbi:hypothetical protein ACFQU2_07920 [Siccirubricoccus deserti]